MTAVLLGNVGCESVLEYWSVPATPAQWHPPGLGLVAPLSSRRHKRTLSVAPSELETSPKYFTRRMTPNEGSFALDFENAANKPQPCMLPFITT